MSPKTSQKKVLFHHTSSEAGKDKVFEVLCSFSTTTVMLASAATDVTDAPATTATCATAFLATFLLGSLVATLSALGALARSFSLGSLQWTLLAVSVFLASLRSLVSSPRSSRVTVTLLSGGGSQRGELGGLRPPGRQSRPLPSPVDAGFRWLACTSR